MERPVLRETSPMPSTTPRSTGTMVAIASSLREPDGQSNSAQLRGVVASMDLNQQKEQFSRAYVQAVAAAAGFATYIPDVDDDSIDMGIAAGGKESRRRPRLELQLKCTAGKSFSWLAGRSKRTPQQWNSGWQPARAGRRLGLRRTVSRERK